MHQMNKKLAINEWSLLIFLKSVPKYAIRFTISYKYILANQTIISVILFYSTNERMFKDYSDVFGRVLSDIFKIPIRVLICFMKHIYPIIPLLFVIKMVFYKKLFRFHQTRIAFDQWNKYRSDILLFIALWFFLHI